MQTVNIKMCISDNGCTGDCRCTSVHEVKLVPGTSLYALAYQAGKRETSEETVNTHQQYD